eukprot:scaffold145269_cov27-Tisochrysis_lutea.AAC.1
MLRSLERRSFQRRKCDGISMERASVLSPDLVMERVDMKGYPQAQERIKREETRERKEHRVWGAVDEGARAARGEGGSTRGKGGCQTSLSTRHLSSLSSLFDPILSHGSFL